MPRTGYGLSPAWLMLFALSFVAIAGLVLHAAGMESTLNHLSRWLEVDADDDSWTPMLAALQWLGDHPGSHTSVYQAIFFEQGVKFQYPLTALLPLSLMQALSVPVSIDALNKLCWFGVPVTAGANAVLFIVASKRFQAIRSVAERRICGALVAPATVLFYPVMKAYSLGQVQTWINAAFGFACLAWLLEDSLVAGVLIGAICLLKPQFSLFLLWGLIRREWRFLGGWALVVIPAALISIALYGFANNLDYLTVLSFLSQHGEAFYPNQSVNGLLQRFLFNGNDLTWDETGFPPFNSIVYTGTLLTSGMLIAAALWWRRSAADPGQRLLDIMGAALSFTMASPIAWEHHYGILLPIILILFLRMLTTEGHLRQQLLLALVGCFVVAASYLSFTQALAPTRLNVIQSYLFFSGFGTLIIVYGFRRSSVRTVMYSPAT